MSRHELYPLKAPLLAMEHCIAPFLDSCDGDNDHLVMKTIVIGQVPETMIAWSFDSRTVSQKLIVISGDSQRMGNVPRT